jgi:hypothetical protein
MKKEYDFSNSVRGLFYNEAKNKTVIIHKSYLTPNERWFLFKGILIGISIGIILSIGIVLFAW